MTTETTHGENMRRMGIEGLCITTVGQNKTKQSRPNPTMRDVCDTDSSVLVQPTNQRNTQDGHNNQYRYHDSFIHKT